jgi:hypothetical protein
MPPKTWTFLEVSQPSSHLQNKKKTHTVKSFKPKHSKECLLSIKDSHTVTPLMLSVFESWCQFQMILVWFSIPFEIFWRKFRPMLISKLVLKVMSKYQSLPNQMGKKTSSGSILGRLNVAVGAAWEVDQYVWCIWNELSAPRGPLSNNSVLVLDK